MDEFKKLVLKDERVPKLTDKKKLMNSLSTKYTSLKNSFEVVKGSF